MTHEEAINRLKEEIDDYTPFAERWNEARLDIKALKIAIQALEQTQWIPVSERLPKKSGEYLVTTDGRYNGEIDIAYFTATDEKFNKAGKIFAWMSLPEPYREDGEEE